MPDPASPSTARALLHAHGLRPRKRWGQNFLCDRNILERIANAAQLTPTDHALEIGPGLGALTRLLADRCAFVTAVEIDTLLAPILDETLAGRENVRLLFADFLKCDTAALLEEAFGEAAGVVAANIPYYITTPILERLLENKARLKRIVLLVQKEFADRLEAKPGTKDYSALTLFAQYHARVEVVMTVSRPVFFPPPEVTSALVVLTPHEKGAAAVEEEVFFRLTRAAFGQRRKTLLNALADSPLGWDRAEVEARLARAGIDPARRGETLSLEEFARLSR